MLNGFPFQGKPTESTIELKVKNFGEIDVKDYIPGAEVLVQEKEVFCLSLKNQKLLFFH